MNDASWYGLPDTVQSKYFLSVAVNIDHFQGKYIYIESQFFEKAKSQNFGT